MPRSIYRGLKLVHLWTVFENYAQPARGKGPVNQRPTKVWKLQEDGSVTGSPGRIQKKYKIDHVKDSPGIPGGTFLNWKINIRWMVKLHLVEILA